MFEKDPEFVTYFERNRNIADPKRLVMTLIQTKYYEYVTYEKYKPAAIFAVLFSNIPFDKDEILGFLKQQTLDIVSSQFNQKFNQVLYSHGILESDEPNPGELSFVDCIHNLFGFVAQILAHHAYADQCFDMKATLLLLSNVQIYIDKFSTKCIRLFVDTNHYDRIYKHIVGKEPLNQRGGLLESLKQNPKLLVDSLEECVLICQATNAYKEFIRQQYETRVLQLRERGYTFHADDNDVESETQLNITKWIVEPLTLYEEISTLQTYYKTIECFHVESHVESLLSLDNIDSFSDLPSILDAAFLSFRRAIERSYMTKSIEIVELVISFVHKFSEKRFLDIINQIYNSTLPRGVSLSNTIKTVIMNDFDDRRKHINTIGPYNQSMVLNIMKTSTLYFKKLEKDGLSTLPQFFTEDDDVEKVKKLLSHVGSISNIFENKIKDHLASLGALFNSIMNKGIQAFLDCRYDIDQHVFKEYELNDPWVKRLIASIKEKIEPYKLNLPQSLFDDLLLTIFYNLSVKLEEAIHVKSFSQFGGFRFNEDVRCIYNMFQGLTATSLRSKFSRLNEISQILSLEKPSELLEYWGSTEVIDVSQMGMDENYVRPSNVWHITSEETKLLMKRRSDFNTTVIDALEL